LTLSLSTTVSCLDGVTQVLAGVLPYLLVTYSKKTLPLEILFVDSAFGMKAKEMLRQNHKEKCPRRSVLDPARDLQKRRPFPMCSLIWSRRKVRKVARQTFHSEGSSLNCLRTSCQKLQPISRVCAWGIRERQNL